METFGNFWETVSICDHHRDTEAGHGQVMRNEKIHRRDAEAGKMYAALSTMSSSYSNAGFTSLRTLRLCGGSVVFPNSLAHSERPCKTATRNGNRCGIRSGNQKRKKGERR